MKTAVLLSGILLLACSAGRNALSAAEPVRAQATELRTSAAEQPDAVVYKTKADFSNRVPVIMDAKHEHIVSYPAPGDVYYRGELAKPTALNDGFWLDNRGINEHVAFLDYTYEEYSRLEQTPDVQVLESRIVERYPLQEMYVCGRRSRFADEVAELNSLIEQGFPGCRKLSLPVSMTVTRARE